MVMAALVICRAAGATGLLIPKDKSIPPLGIKNHRVSVTLKDGVATTRLTEVFYNSTSSRLEATYVFPIPREAALTDFAMYVNGKRQSGRIVEAEQARQVYQDIVRRMRDPGLLEYMGANLLRMSVFPIEPQSTQKIEVSYAYALPFDGGLYRYTFPLKTGEKASKVLEDSTFSVEITSARPVSNIYSPTHKVGISRKGDNNAIVGFEEEGAMLDKDFVLYYSLADKDFGLNLLTCCPEGEDGYFALMLAPRLGIEEKDVMPKDVCFLLDVSGSMSGPDNRIQSAKDAIKFCLKALNPRDRFAIVTFSTGVDVFADGVADATEQNVAEAIAFVDGLEARGGTRLCGAVLEGLKMAPQGGRPYIVLLITDGIPTVGVVEADKIITQVKAANKNNIRVFSFGIAENLDVPLLDLITETTRGYSTYVAPGREIEMEVAGLFRKVSHPVLANLKLNFGKVKVHDVYPDPLPDLFRGSQVVAFGRYSGSGEVAVELTGVVRGEEKMFAYDAQFPEVAAGTGFIAHLWAQRKIAYLLDQVRLHGEQTEVRAEVIRLSREYGIATPYTSYLVLEDEQAYIRHGIVKEDGLRSARRLMPGATSAPVRGKAGAPEGSHAVRREAGDAQAAEELERAGRALNWNGSVAGFGGKLEGKDAVALSQTIRRWKDADGDDSGLGRVRAGIKKVGEKTFLKVGQVYVDTELAEEMTSLRVTWASDAYFALLDAAPELTQYLALGENVIVVVGGKALIVGEEGKEELTDEEIQEFLEQE